MVEGGTDRQRRGDIDADDDRGVRYETELARAASDDIPGLPPGVGQRLVLDVGTAFAINTGVTAGAGAVQRGAGAAISWPAAEVPVGAGANAFFSSSSSSAGPR